VVDQGPLLAERLALQQRNHQLFLSERRLESVINSALDAIICLDQDQRITVFNPTAAALFLCPPHDALGSPLERFLPDAAQALSFAPLTTQAVLGEMTARTASGREIPVEVSVSFEHHSGGETTTVFARDLVRQILTFSRNEPPQRKPVQAREVMGDTARLLRVTMPPGVELLVHVPPQLPPMLADAMQVEQALFNLCTNAMHALGERRGLIQMDADLVRPDQRLCERLGLPQVSYVALSVQDNGPGMDARTLQRIFEPFFTTKPVGQGTGLGLPVVHGVMRNHGGAVDVYSIPGQGSRFTLYFPPAEAPTLAEPAPAQPPSAEALPSAPEPSAAAETPTGPQFALLPDPQAAQQHVMYVDDDQALVFLVQRLLRRRGYQVSGFTDPHEATEALRAAPRDYDLLVTDYNMPGYSGIDLVHEALSIQPHLPIALASGYITTEIEQAALAAGARALVHKPNDVEELCATVHRLLNER
jgi:PAS domain S-box-containing protein